MLCFSAMFTAGLLLRRSRPTMRPLLLLWVVAAVGCGSSQLPHPPYVSQTTEALVEVPYPPPPARAEFVPSAPRKDATWLDGEWIWRGRRWSWVRGRWVAPPPRARYAPWTTVRNSEGALFFAPGGWRDESGKPMEPPPPLAEGYDVPGKVTDMEGEKQDVPSVSAPGGAGGKGP